MSADAERTDGTPRTIEEIEQRAAEIHEAEREALTVLVHCIREIAVRLPSDSRLPLDLAEAAKTLELYTHAAGHPRTGVGVSLSYCGTLERAIRDYMPKGEES